MTDKVRAERNRTLTVSESEVPALEKYILTADDLVKSFADNTIVNADLFDCLDIIPNNYFRDIQLIPTLYFLKTAKYQIILREKWSWRII